MPGPSPCLRLILLGTAGDCYRLVLRGNQTLGTRTVGGHLVLFNLSRELLLGRIRTVLVIIHISSRQLYILHVIRCGQDGFLTITVKVDRHRLVINLAVAIEVDSLPGGSSPIVQAVGIATKAGLLVQLVLVQVLVDAGRVAEVLRAVRAFYALSW